MTLLRLLRDIVHTFRSRMSRAGAGGSPSSDRAQADAAMRESEEFERQGNPAAALAVLERLIAAGHRSAAVHARAGALCGQLGRLPQARAHFASALEAEPGHAGAHADLGTALALSGDFDASIRHYREALRLSPGDLRASCNLARVLGDAGDVDGAFAMYAEALREAPRDEGALRGLVSLSARMQTHEAALRIAQDIAARHVDHAAAHSACGFLLLKRAFDPARALRHLDQALDLGLRDADTLSNRAIALQDLGRLEEAERAYDEALASDPGNRVVRFHRSLVMLLLGRFETAWNDYELRLESEDLPRAAPPCPRWDGTPIPDLALLVWAEQGLGDEIMFASCLHEAIARSGRCVIDCNPRLASLFERSFPGVEVHAVEQRAAPRWNELGRIDRAIPAGSLPSLFRRSAGAFPVHQGYLRADAARCERMRARLRHAGSMRPIGLSWRGGTLRSRAPMRSLALDQLLPLLRIPGILWVSLQYDASAREVEEFARLHDVQFVHWQDAIDDIEETAALASCVERTISVCTSLVHLCGALGAPVRVLAPFSPEWRYGARGEGMVWYPSARIARQSQPGEWQGVLDAIAAELRVPPGRAGAA